MGIHFINRRGVCYISLKRKYMFHTKGTKVTKRMALAKLPVGRQGRKSARNKYNRKERGERKVIKTSLANLPVGRQGREGAKKCITQRARRSRREWLSQSREGYEYIESLGDALR